MKQPHRQDEWVREYISMCMTGWQTVNERVSNIAREKMKECLPDWLTDCLTQRMSECVGEWVSELQWTSKWETMTKWIRSGDKETVWLEEWVKECVNDWVRDWVWDQKKPK